MPCELDVFGLHFPKCSTRRRRSNIISASSMHIDWQAFRRARLARDPRFDGKFFVGVLSTKIYCRPSCPVPTVKDSNIRYFETAARGRGGLSSMSALPPGVLTGNSGLVRYAEHRVTRLAIDCRKRIRGRRSRRSCGANGGGLASSAATIRPTFRSYAERSGANSPPAFCKKAH